MKLNIGAGSDIRKDFTNLDIAMLPGIDVVHNLNSYPWPFLDNQFDYIIANDVIEHLENVIQALEELHRISKLGATIEIQVPYWNSWSRHTDPTHKNSFTEDTFRFFDPKHDLCKERPYYSKARFDIAKETFVVTPILPNVPLPIFNYLEFTSSWSKWWLKLFANFFCNVIQDLKYELKKV